MLEAINDLQPLRGCERWENFAKVVEKAMIACENSEQIAEDHFANVRKMVEIGCVICGNLRNLRNLRIRPGIRLHI